MASVLTPQQTLSIHPVANSRLNQVDFNNLPFGTVFTDHEFVVEFDGNSWVNPRVEGFSEMTISPAFSGLHYGQSIFEGMKAYRDANGHIRVFRPQAHLDRLNRSADRLCMPEIPYELFIEGLKAMVQQDADWVPQEVGSQLYIRPIYFATDPFLGVRPSSTYCLRILACPVGAYYKEPVRVFVTDKYVRATTGGVGNVKMAGNYARTLKISKEKAQQGFHVVLWLDAIRRTNVEEFSTMNAFFVIGDVVITPRITGTILEGITRDSALTLLREGGFKVEERDISIQEVMSAGRNGLLKEAFGTGTAAVVSPVALLHYDEEDVTLPPYEEWRVAPYIAEHLRSIRIGTEPDRHNWLVQLA
jgi:branched-chain amino acid aminotransferase